MATIPMAIFRANQKAEEKKRFGRVTLPYSDSKGNPNSEEYAKIYKHISKQRGRIKRLSLLIRGPETPRNAELYADIRAKIQKYEGIISRCEMKIKQREAEKGRIDAREKKKLDNRLSVQNLEKVRLERGKLVDYIPLKIEEGETPKDAHKVTYLSKTNKGTNRDPIYVETTKEKIRNDFLGLINKPDPKKREKTVSEPFPYMKKKRMLQEYYSSRNQETL